ncbi:MAG: hypothetical protein ACJ0Q6_06290 [Candidatus Azotimanducaceae bacterium]
MLQDFKTLQNLIIYVSGGPDMVYATRDAFKAHGMREHNIFSDMFSYLPR